MNTDLLAEETLLDISRTQREALSKAIRRILALLEEGVAERCPPRTGELK